MPEQVCFDALWIVATWSVTAHRWTLATVGNLGSTTAQMIVTTFAVPTMPHSSRTQERCVQREARSEGHGDHVLAGDDLAAAAQFVEDQQGRR